jgi:hypothetical protein
MLEFLISGLVLYFTNFNNALTTFVFMKSLFSNNYKTALFMIFNFLIYSTLGPSYILFAKLYFLSILVIFLHDKIKYLLTFDKLDKEEEQLNKLGLKKIGFFENIYSKVLEFYNFINTIISIPFYILFDNVSLLIQEIGLTKYIQNNKYYKKLKESYSLMNDIKNFDKMENFDKLEKEFKINMPKLPDMSALENSFNNCSDDELDELLDEMLNPKKIMNMTNNMRETIGKKPLSQDEYKNKINNLENLFGMFNNSFEEFGNITKILKDLENEEKTKKY